MKRSRPTRERFRFRVFGARWCCRGSAVGCRPRARCWPRASWPLVSRRAAAAVSTLGRPGGSRTDRVSLIRRVCSPVPIRRRFLHLRASGHANPLLLGSGRIFPAALVLVGFDLFFWLRLPHVRATSDGLAVPRSAAQVSGVCRLAWPAFSGRCPVWRLLAARGAVYLCAWAYETLHD